jgi:hypothetical protein
VPSRFYCRVFPQPVRAMVVGLGSAAFLGLQFNPGMGSAPAARAGTRRFYKEAKQAARGRGPWWFDSVHQYGQTGALGNLARANAKSQAAISRGAGRQNGGAGSKPKAAASSKSSSDDGDGASDPDRSPPHSLPRQLYTFKEVACYTKINHRSLRNAVAAGRVPAPIQTLFGPRFTDEHLYQIVQGIGPQPETEPPKRRLGRPRIAHQHATLDKKGGEA